MIVHTIVRSRILFVGRHVKPPLSLSLQPQPPPSLHLVFQALFGLTLQHAVCSSKRDQEPAISILVLPAVAGVSLRIMLYADHTSTSFGLPRNVKEECVKKASWYEWPLQKRERECEGGREREHRDARSEVSVRKVER